MRSRAQMRGSDAACIRVNVKQDLSQVQPYPKPNTHTRARIHIPTAEPNTWQHLAPPLGVLCLTDDACACRLVRPVASSRRQCASMLTRPKRGGRCYTSACKPVHSQAMGHKSLRDRSVAEWTNLTGRSCLSLPYSGCVEPGI